MDYKGKHKGSEIDELLDRASKAVTTEQIDNTIEDVETLPVVLYAAQDLTDEQKSQARINIDAYFKPDSGIPKNHLSEEVLNLLNSSGAGALQDKDIKGLFGFTTLVGELSNENTEILLGNISTPLFIIAEATNGLLNKKVLNVGDSMSLGGITGPSFTISYEPVSSGSASGSAVRVYADNGVSGYNYIYVYRDINSAFKTINGKSIIGEGDIEIASNEIYTWNWDGETMSGTITEEEYNAIANAKVIILGVYGGPSDIKMNLESGIVLQYELAGEMMYIQFFEAGTYEVTTQNLLDEKLSSYAKKEEIPNEVVIGDSEPQDADIWIDTSENSEDPGTDTNTPILDAPADGKSYARKNNAWSDVSNELSNYLTKDDFNAKIQFVTQAEYTALGNVVNSNGVIYFITE